MRKWTRETYVKHLLADEICILLEDLYFNRKITLQERDDWYIKFATRCELKDLFPGVPAYNYRALDDHLENLKDDLKKKHKNIVNLFAIRRA